MFIFRPSINWNAGWGLILAGFASGALMGLSFHHDDFLGGYGSFRRRLLRLGHIACAALGMLNLIVARNADLSVWACRLLVLGGITMPAVCFLTAWRKPCRHLFCVPVVSLVAAAVLFIGKPGPSTPPDELEGVAYVMPKIDLEVLR